MNYDSFTNYFMKSDNVPFFKEIRKFLYFKSSTLIIHSKNILFYFFYLNYVKKTSIFIYLNESIVSKL